MIITLLDVGRHLLGTVAGSPRTTKSKKQSSLESQCVDQSVLAKSKKGLCKTKRGKKGKAVFEVTVLASS